MPNNETTDNPPAENLKLQLQYGYTRGLPPGVTTAWGCRAIITQDGYVDVVWDRTTIVGPRSQELLQHLRDLPDLAWQAEVSRKLTNGSLSTREYHEVTVWRDGRVVIKANPNNSGGYLYVCAYFYEEEAD